MAIGSFGLRPIPSERRVEISHAASAKRSACQASAGFLSTLEMHRLMKVGVCSGAIESARIRPSEGSSGSMATFDGIFIIDAIEQIVNCGQQPRCYDKKIRRVLNGRTILDVWTRRCCNRL